MRLKYQNGGRPGGDPKKNGMPDWYPAFLHALSGVESSYGKNMINPKTTATGLYQQMYDEIKDMPEMKGVSRADFAKDLKLQRQIQDMRMRGEIPEVPGLLRNVRDIKSKNLSPDEVAAMSHFIGRDGLMQQLKSGYDIPGENASFDEYLSRYRKARSTYKPPVAESDTIPMLPVSAPREVTSDLQNAFKILRESPKVSQDLQNAIDILKRSQQ